MFYSSKAEPEEDQQNFPDAEKIVEHDLAGLRLEGGESSSSGARPSRPQVQVASKELSVNELYYFAQIRDPTPGEINRFAQYLAREHHVSQQCLWVVEEALRAPLPAGWSEHTSGHRIFFYHQEKNISSWQHPLEPLYVHTYASLAKFMKLEHHERIDKMKRYFIETVNLETLVNQEVRMWVPRSGRDKNSKSKSKKATIFFWFNQKTGEKSMTDPRQALVVSVYLRMRMLRQLTEFLGDEIEQADDKRAGTGYSSSSTGRDASARGAPQLGKDNQEDAEWFRQMAHSVDGFFSSRHEPDSEAAVLRRPGKKVHVEFTHEHRAPLGLDITFSHPPCLNKVVEGSPADGEEFKKHDLQKGDLLLKVNGVYIGDQEHKAGEVMKMMSRRPLKLTFFRPTVEHVLDEGDEDDEDGGEEGGYS